MYTAERSICSPAMSSPDSDRFVKVAAGVAIIAAVVFGSLYLGTLFGPTSTSTTDPPSTTKDTVLPAKVERPAPSGGGGLQGVGAPNLPMVMEMATRPTVKPDSEKDGVRAELTRVLVDFEQCWHDAVGTSPSRKARFFVHFTVGDEGKPTESSVQTKGVGDPDMDICLRAVLETTAYASTKPGTTVYWPIQLDPKDGLSL